MNIKTVFQSRSDQIPNVLQQSIWTFLISILFWVILSCSTTAYASNPQVTQIFNQLATTPLVRAKFEQQKKIASVNKVFNSSGNIVFSKSQGVLWQIRNPVQADLVVTAKKLIQKTQRTQSEVNVAQSPYGSVSTMFLQLMAGDQAALNQHFNIVSAQYTPAQWNIVLTPKSTLFKKLFVRVEAQGQRYVERIVITEQASNMTTIRFSQHSSQPQTLSASENALFQLAK